MEILGKTVQIDLSGGQGHIWKPADEDNCLPSTQEEIAAEIIDGGIAECDDYVATNGEHYRWS